MSNSKPEPLTAEDYYLDAQGRFVLTEKYLRKRGYCCGNGCRHCPYPKGSNQPDKSKGDSPS